MQGWFSIKACFSLKKFFTCPIFIPVHRLVWVLAQPPVSLYHPSGMYLRTTKGIFFSLSSLMAICKGSVSPSRSTSTGAFLLRRLSAKIFLLGFSRRILRIEQTYLICSALTPSTLARSYLVIYGVVVRFSLAIFFPFNPTTAFCFPVLVAPASSPTSTT